MKETDYYGQINHRCRQAGLYAWSIATVVQNGVPDCFYRHETVFTGNQRPLWVEYKFIKRLPKRPDTLVVPNLSQLQRQWLEDARLANEQAWVIIGIERVDGYRGAQGVILAPDEWDGIKAVDAFERIQGYDQIVEQIAAAVA